mgnify:FL=1
MRKTLGILKNSLRLTFHELGANKLRTTLSITGVAFGIFCIVICLSFVDSITRNIQGEVKSLGSNTIYIDKWSYAGGPDYPWWKYVKRPVPKIEEMRFVKAKCDLAANTSFFSSTNVNASYKDNILSNVSLYGITEDFNNIQTLDIAAGRYLNESEFTRGTTSTVIGNLVADELYGGAQKAVGKQITYNGKHLYIVGVIKKQGQSLIGGFNFDECMITSYRYFSGVYNPDNSSPYIMVQGKPGVSSAALAEELRGVMRQLRRLSPSEEDDFSCNDVAQFSEVVGGFFGKVTAGGWAIAGLSLIVGAFGVANIMFVTVRERTSQIGLKKALGAKRRTILTEFLLESAFLCILGGLFGLILVWLLAMGLTAVLPFPIFIAPNIVFLALSICIILGIVSGIIPASIAAKMDPVVAIRTK